MQQSHGRSWRDPYQKVAESRFWWVRSERSVSVRKSIDQHLTLCCGSRACVIHFWARSLDEVRHCALTQRIFGEFQEVGAH